MTNNQVDEKADELLQVMSLWGIDRSTTATIFYRAFKKAQTISSAKYKSIAGGMHSTDQEDTVRGRVFHEPKGEA